MGMIEFFQKRVRGAGIQSGPTGSYKDGFLVRVVADSWSVHLELHPLNEDSGPLYIAALGRTDCEELAKSLLNAATEQLGDEFLGDDGASEEPIA